MLTLREIATIVDGAELMGPGELRIAGLSTDSRTLVAGELFVALSGDRYDGQEFLGAAIEAGAAAALVQGPVASPIPMIRVPDTRRALGEIARAWRQRFQIPVIVVVGSNGKTTTKEMISAILAAQYGEEGRLATRGNLNNEIGVPLTLLRMRTAHRAAVIEVGMNHPRETGWLTHIASPTVVVITNAQREHQEFMKSVAAVAQEHALAIEVLSQDGIAVFCALDDYAGLWRSAAMGRKTLEFAVNREGADVAIRSTAHLDRFDTVMHLDTPRGAITARIAAVGLHNACNATAAAAAALAAELTLEPIQLGLERFRPVAGRLEFRRATSGAVLIDDTYNANPDSVRAAIDVLARSPAATLLVVGDMGEVGDAGSAFHAEIGSFARESGIDELFALGVQMRVAASVFGAGSTHFSDLPGLIVALRQWVGAPGHEEATILVKGSRFMRMEEVVHALVDDATLARPPSGH